MKTNINKKLLSSASYSLSIAAVSIALVLSNMSPVFASSINSENILELINEERSSRGLQTLTLDPSLDAAARLKSKDMLNRDYFEHFAFGLAPWDFIINAGYDYLYAGENLAMDFSTSEGTVNAWMNSPAHRENILNPDFRETGIGVVKGEFNDGSGPHTTTMTTNMFGRKKPAIVKIFNNVYEKIMDTLF